MLLDNSLLPAQPGQDTGDLLLQRPCSQREAALEVSSSLNHSNKRDIMDNHGLEVALGTPRLARSPSCRRPHSSRSPTCSMRTQRSSSRTVEPCTTTWTRRRSRSRLRRSTTVQPRHRPSRSSRMSVALDPH